MASVVDGVVADRAPAAPRIEVRWDEVVPCVHRQMRSLVGPIPELEDLTQMALEQVLKSIDRFEGRAELTTFTYAVCANIALRHFRSWRRFVRRFDPDRSEIVDSTPAAIVETTDRLIEHERVRRLYRALDRIEANKRITVVLADLEELPASRIATILDIPEPTVRSRLRTARIELHAILRRDPLFAPEGSR